MNQIKTTTPSSLSYNGKVTIKTYDKKRKKIVNTKIIKNNGTLNLFKFLCNCLIGQYTSNNRPRYLDASASVIKPSTETEITEFKSCLYYRSILTPANLLETKTNTLETSSGNIESANVYVKFSTQILKGQLDSTSADQGIKSLVLTNSPQMEDSTSSVLAWINLPEDITIGENQTVLIEWDLSFNNYIKPATLGQE